MTPRQHLDLVVQPNMNAMLGDLDDIRLAFNAIAAVDALAAQIYWWAVHNHPSLVAGLVDDTEYRQQLAGQNNDFRLLFETAKAIKHGRLTRGKPPSVRAVDQIVAKSPGWGEQRWDYSRWDISQVRIEPIGEAGWSVEGVLLGALSVLEAEMLRLQVP
jgi:hypothetical protein